MTTRPLALALPLALTLPLALAAPGAAMTVPPSGGIGRGGGYASEVGQPGITINGFYRFVPRVRVAGDVMIFRSESVTPSDEPQPRQAWEANINLHVILSERRATLVYGLAGVNRTHIDLEVPPELTLQRGSETATGINAGLGAETFRGRWGLFGEVKYTLFGPAAAIDDQLGVAAGVRFHLRPPP